jgi:chromosome partitioning protein
MLVVVGGIKGGGGKTTLATNLAVWSAMRGKKTLLVDADEQKSATSWAEQRAATKDEYPNEKPFSTFATISLAGKFIYQHLEKLKPDYDNIIVDTGGRDTTTQRSALIVADKFLVPFKPRSLDVWTLSDVKRLIDEIQVTNHKMKSYFVINQGDSRGTDNEDARELIADSDCMECIPEVLGYRKAFSNAAAEGLGVWEVEKRDQKACDEMGACALYILGKCI